jgi:hypothetical protein
VAKKEYAACIKGNLHAVIYVRLISVATAFIVEKVVRAGSDP